MSRADYSAGDNLTDRTERIEMDEIRGEVLVGPKAGSIRGVAARDGSSGFESILVVANLDIGDYDSVTTASAIVCSSGGRTGHVPSICRALGIPILRVDDIDLARVQGFVTIDLSRESLWLGDRPTARLLNTKSVLEPAHLGDACVVVAGLTDLVAVNHSSLLASQTAQLFFIREEFICLEVGLNPVESLSNGSSAATSYGETLGRRVAEYVGHLTPSQRIVVRLLDLRSDDASRYGLGSFPVAEPNPELGNHGARWLRRSEYFVDALGAFCEMTGTLLGFDASRMSLAVPFVNDATEYLELREHLRIAPEANVSAFVETPAAAFATSELCAAGVSELFVGTKDLVQFVLAADRSNHGVAPSYQTQHPAVISALQGIVRSASAGSTKIFVYSLLADLRTYVDLLPTPTGYMMCTAEFLQLIQDASVSIE